MNCEKCLKECCEKDFMPNQIYCYKCTYEMKCENQNKDKKKPKCRVCKSEIKFKPNSKTRQRNVFCSEKCAKEGHKEITNNFWTRQIKSVLPVSWKFS